MSTIALPETSNGYERDASTDQLCWRITRELLKSIESCPNGSLDACMRLVEGSTCCRGKRIKM